MSSLEQVYAGIDLGGTKLAIGVFDRMGQLLAQETFYDHVTKSEDRIVGMMENGIRSVLQKGSIDESNLAGIGVTFPGHLRYRSGVTITTSNIAGGFKNYPLRDRIQERFSAAVVLDNDANAQAFAEYAYGAGKDYDSLVFMTISSGIGAGIILDGRIFRGQTGTAGEVGHTIVDPDSEITCTCGNRGCLMSLAGGHALPVLYARAMRNGVPSALFRDPKDAEDEFDGKAWAAGIADEDPTSMHLLDYTTNLVALGLYNMFQILNPPLFVLGGGILELGSPYFDRINSRFHALLQDMAVDPVEIAIAQFTSSAGMIGAAALAMAETDDRKG